MKVPYHKSSLANSSITIRIYILVGARGTRGTHGIFCLLKYPPSVKLFIHSRLMILGGFQRKFWKTSKEPQGQISNVTNSLWRSYFQYDLEKIY